MSRVAGRATGFLGFANMYRYIGQPVSPSLVGRLGRLEAWWDSGMFLTFSSVQRETLKEERSFVSMVLVSEFLA